VGEGCGGKVVGLLCVVPVSCRIDVVSTVVIRCYICCVVCVVLLRFQVGYSIYFTDKSRLNVLGVFYLT
jgi:hypothetical protein